MEDWNWKNRKEAKLYFLVLLLLPPRLLLLLHLKFRISNIAGCIKQTAAMDSLSSISPSIVLPPNNHFQLHHRQGQIIHLSSCPRKKHITTTTKLCNFFNLPLSPEISRRRTRDTSCGVSNSGGGGGAAEEEEERKDGGGGGGEIDEEEEEVERALHLDGSIPGTSDEFVKQVSSRAYDMRRHLQQTFDSSSYDVLEANPWHEASKPVYVLTQRENQLCTMKTRRNRSEVEKELGLLFSKGRRRRSEIGNKSKQSKNDTNFRMLVEDVREGVLVFEDEKDAARYCDLLQGGGQGCEGVAEVDASSVFDICQKMRALAVLFRRGRTPPLPESLQLNLRAKKRSLEDQEDLI